MACGLFAALTKQGFSADRSAFTFQHKLCHDFESLTWVIVYAMMIRHRNALAATDQVMYGEYKKILDICWAVHSYGNLHRSRSYMIMVGCSADCLDIVSLWFPDAREAAFFRDAMRLLRNQTDGTPITYEDMCTLFKKHIRLAKYSDDSVAPTDPTMAL